jgi:hypothetical protein
MARILVQADDQRTVLLDEKAIRPEHMNNPHSAAQLLERLEWAITEAERRTVGASRKRRRRAVIPSVQSALGRTFD